MDKKINQLLGIGLEAKERKEIEFALKMKKFPFRG